MQGSWRIAQIPEGRTDGLMGWLWWLLAAASLTALVLWLHRRAEAAAAERAAVIARVDQQHAWVLAGNPRGTYGSDFMPRTEVPR